MTTNRHHRKTVAHASSHTKYWFLVCYDIRRANRLQKVQRLLKRVALMLQESVYLFSATLAEAAHMRQRLQRIIQVQQDDVRMYQLSANCHFDFYHHLPWGDLIYLSDLPAHSISTLTPVQLNTAQLNDIR